MRNSIISINSKLISKPLILSHSKWICSSCERNVSTASTPAIASSSRLSSISSSSSSSSSNSSSVPINLPSNQSSNSSLTSINKTKNISIQDRLYEIDEWSNVNDSVLSHIGKELHVNPDHPISITRSLIESQFQDFKKFISKDPVVSTYQNFDSLGFSKHHIGRNKTDTYYVNQSNVLRTHTSAHQIDIFQSNKNQNWLLSADVYRRDTVDKSHYPIFHQMEGVRVWNIEQSKSKSLKEDITNDIENLSKHNIEVIDDNPFYDSDKNPIQACHNKEDVELITKHLKLSLEHAFINIFRKAKEIRSKDDQLKEGQLKTLQSLSIDSHGQIQSQNQSHVHNNDNHPLKMRWVEAYFPFTSPSWELEIFWENQWLEVLGSGIIKQNLLDNAKCSNNIGWAFGIGLERIAMTLFQIPDIRLFWSNDNRFLSQFKENQINYFKPFSKYPSCYKDISFWLPLINKSDGKAMNQMNPKGSNNNLQNNSLVHENDIMEVIRDICGNIVEDVHLIDEFEDKKTKRQSKCYRINYRSLEKTLTNDETNQLNERVRNELVKRLNIELR